MTVEWKCVTFNALNPHQLYAIIQLRNEVFVVEQQCIFQDADNKDQHCNHLMGWHEKTLVAYTRLVPAGVIYNEASIGRVVTSLMIRKSGIGRELMLNSINWIHSHWGKQAIKIGAQQYLKTFYESLGFQQCSDVYVEDNIPHIHMILKLE